MREEFQNLHRTNQEMAILLHLLEEKANKNEGKQNHKVTELRNRIEHLNQINQEKESQLHNLEEEAKRRDDQHCVEMSAMVERIVNLNKKVEEWSLQLKTFEEEARIKENRQQNENAELKEKIEQLKTFQEKALQLQALEEEFRIKQNEYSLQLATLSEQIEHLNKENKEKNEQMKNFEEESHRKKDEYSCKIAELDKKIENLNKTNLENFDRIKKLEEELQKKKDEYSHKIANLVERMGNLNKENIEKSNQLNILNEQMEYLKKTNLEKEDHIRQLDGEKADLNSKLNSLKLENEKLLNEKEVLSLANAPIITTACSRFVSQPNNEYHYPNSSPPAYSGLQVEPYIQSTQGRSCLPPSERLSPNTSLSVIEENSENTHNQSQQQKSPSPKPRVFKLKGFAEQKKPPPNAQLSKRNLIKKRQLTNAANSSISSKFSKKKQMPVNVLANEKPWRPHGSKQNQLIKPSHLHNKTPTNNEKSAKRKLQLGSTIGSPMFSSTPNNGGLKFPQFVLN